MKKYLLYFYANIIFGLDFYIPPEIKNDSFYSKIIEIASNPEIRTILEIGASCGEGSTSAFVTGISQNPSKPDLFCIEISKFRFEFLKNYYGNNPQIHLYNVSSVPVVDFPTKEEVTFFLKTYRSKFRKNPLDLVLSWLDQDINYIKSSNVDQNGIETIKRENKIDFFDLVLIDGSEFTGKAELDKVYGAKYILLDDILSYKNFDNYRKLLEDKNYRLIDRDLRKRNRWAAFEKVAFDEQPRHPLPSPIAHKF
jgi:hypothetical protein